MSSDSSSQTRGDAREILYTAPAAVLHGIESAVSSAKQLFRRVAILGKSGYACTHGDLWSFGLRRKAFANARDDARGDVPARFRQNESKFVAAVARSRVNSTRMIAQNLSNAH